MHSTHSGHFASHQLRRPGVPFRVLLVSAIAAAVRLALDPIIGDMAHYTFFVLSVGASAVLWGLNAGLFATTLGAVTGFFMFVYMPGRFQLHHTHDYVNFSIFLLVSVGISVIGEWGRRQTRRLQQDIKKRKAAEKELETARRQWEETFENVPDLIAIMDRDHRILRVNRAMAQHLGATPEECVGMPCYHCNGLETTCLDKGLESYAKVQVQEVYEPRLKGYFSVSCTPLCDENGGITAIVRVAHDITETKRAEHELRERDAFLRKVIDCTPSMVFVKNWDGVFLLVNEALAETYGASVDDIVGKTDSDFNSSEMELETFRRDDRFVMSSHRGLFIKEEPVTGADGKTRWFSTAKVPLIEEDGSCTKILGISTDITTRKQLEEDAKKARLAAEEANAAKDQFLAVLSHELRTPLTPVVAGIALMERKHPEFSGELEVIKRNIGVEARLIDDLLDLTRIARGKIALEKRFLDLRDVIREAVDVCKPDIERRKLDLEVDLGARPLSVNGDPSRLQQVFWNLVKNSVKFTPESGCISISAESTGQEITVEVRDTGLGIDPDSLVKIFNAFEQADKKVTRQFGGLGLGLAITRRLVEMHGGSIRASSGGKGKGSVFTVVLPESTGQLVRSSEPAPSRVSEPSGLKILLVEDHGDTAQMTASLLESAGYRVNTAGDVAQALKEIRSQQFDLLISDLGLPDRSGLELIHEIHENGSTLKGIALSGFGREEDVRKSLEAGFSEHLTKPVDADTLTAVIERVAARGPA